MGGSSGGTTTQIIQPTPPPQPSLSSTIQDYVASLPALYEAQLKYAPMEAQQQIDLANKYAVPLAQAYKNAQETLYPGTSGLQEQLVAQAREGSTGQVPQAMQDQYRSDLTAQLGENVKSGVGADYVSRNLINQQQQYNQYYQNLGLSLAGRQPLVNPQSPGYTNQLAQYNPGQALNFSQGNYGVFAQAGRPIVSQNTQGMPNWISGLQAGGSVLQGLGQMGFMGAPGCWVASELFGGWNKPKTNSTRYFINFIAPSWLRRIYLKYGFKISQVIRRHKQLKILLRPMFELFALIGKGGQYASMV